MRSIDEKVLILGATGLLGHVLLKTVHNFGFNAFGTYRSHQDLQLFSASIHEQLIYANDLLDYEELTNILVACKPTVVINCLSLSNPLGQDYDTLLRLYSIFPRLLFNLCKSINARYIHISSDGVFSGNKGNYTEEDYTDADDKYGICKILGEIDSVNSLTIRTSIIGPSLKGDSGLMDWFFNQSESCFGYSNYIFSALTTFELSKIISELIIPDRSISGIYHIGSNRISKLDLLRLLSHYGQKKITIIEKNEPLCDRSLSSKKFSDKKLYREPAWTTMIEEMLQLTNMRAKDVKK